MNPQDQLDSHPRKVNRRGIFLFKFCAVCIGKLYYYVVLVARFQGIILCKFCAVCTGKYYHSVAARC
jgi:hypothetical protein